MMLVLSALLTTAALRVPDQHWLAWISFLPLFAVVRWLRPSVAVLAGGLWGACLYLFCSAGLTPAVDTAGPAIALSYDAQVGVHALAGPSAWLLALLILIPAVYVGLAARPTRAIGFKLLTLALGWTLIEVVVAVAQTYPPSPDFANSPEPRASARAAYRDRVARSHATPRKLKHAAQNGSSQRTPEPRASVRAVLQDQHTPSTLLNHGSPHQTGLPGAQAEGLLGRSQGAGLQNHWLARLLGYVGSAFLVACVNASLVGILSVVRLRSPQDPAVGASPQPLGWLPSQEVLPIQSWIVRQANPRAPPIPFAPIS
ncbi:MAG: hypothetical protein ACE5E5_00700 [Phycisphaerae bacterium]